MSRADKLLASMRRNPAADWTIEDVRKVCEALGWQCLPPTGGGSHWKVAVPGNEAILTVPAKRPIKPIYIRKLMDFVKAAENGPQAD
ncbi:MAG: type II toxin-antitoxin system HicA family toxin [Sphingomonadales bacterium]|nr:type II toxin-antitoxin system HicA family toxin [Sphingomonadales bacterium]